MKSICAVFIVVMGILNPLLLAQQSNKKDKAPLQISVYPPSAVQSSETARAQAIVDDTIKLSKAGFSDDIIIQQIKNRGRVRLSADQLIQLRNASISRPVLQALLGGQVAAVTSPDPVPQPEPAPTPVVEADSLSFSHTKPVILISGNGNVSINSSGQGVGGIHGGVGWAAGTGGTAINQHDQTMEMAGDFSKFCPAVELTLSQAAQPDYFVFLNREGQPTVFGELGQSQIMVLNKRKSIIFEVGKKATVKNAVKSACNAIAADWQANGLLAVNAPASVAPITPNDSALRAAPVPSQPVLQAASMLPPQPKLGTVAIVMHTTASAEKYCKPETIASILSDTNAYVTSKGLILGTAATSKTTLVLIVNRPVMKWIEITIQGRDGSGNVLWGETVSEGAWAASTHLGTQGMLNTLEKVHQVIDARLK
jgi:hypothetical protein